ncbi:methylosome subunit pICln-like protein, partial [Euroglyphus maynei]
VEFLFISTLAFFSELFAFIARLYLTFTWRKENGQGFSLEYPQISLHATSRDLNNFHSECLYL